MKLVYASRTGNVQKLVNKLGVADALKIADGTETVAEDFVLITYTDGKGNIPKTVKAFLDANAANCKGAAVSGNKDRFAATFTGAADEIAAQYGLPIIARFHMDGDDEVVEAIKAAL